MVIERKILAVLQGGFPESRTPYKDMAEQAGVEREELLAVLEDWKRRGVIRRIGAIVDSTKIGLSAGAMVVWRVGAESVERIGGILAGFDEVSHAYERAVCADWPYNVYTMVHGASDEEVRRTVERMSRACGVSKYRVLVTEKELKKTPPRYVT
jgi:DNA-binding Lrp family transcriptional regulator